MLYDAVFQSQVIHEAPGPMIVGPLLHQDEFADAIGLLGAEWAMTVLEIFIDAVESWMVAVIIDAFLFPDLDMVGLTAFSQHPRLIITDGYQANAAPEAGSWRSVEGD